MTGFLRDATLSNGQTIRIRDIERDDRALVEEGFAHLSDRSRFMRFLAARNRLTEAELDTLTDPTDENDVALGAIRPRKDGPPDPVGVARFIRLAPGSDSAELALTVVDDFHGLGAGTHLMRALIDRARQCNVSRLIALVRRDNHAMRRLLTKFGGQKAPEDGPEIEIHLDVADSA
ncbi:MAG: GNAT family N-acetyltransferase [Pseudomonadota bacterium]